MRGHWFLALRLASPSRTWKEEVRKGSSAGESGQGTPEPAPQATPKLSETTSCDPELWVCGNGGGPTLVWIWETLLYKHQYFDRS